MIKCIIIIIIILGICLVTNLEYHHLDFKENTFKWTSYLCFLTSLDSTVSTKRSIFVCTWEKQIELKELYYGC